MGPRVEQRPKSYHGHPFGIQAARFSKTGLHPNMQLTGTISTSHDPNVGPGSYEVIARTSTFSDLVDKRKKNGPDWKRAHFVETTASLPHFLYKEEYDLKREQKRKLGPGTYDIPDEPIHRDSSCFLKSKTPRFPREKRDTFPGPGVYGIKGIPDTLKVMKDDERKNCNTVGLLDRGPVGRMFYRVNKNMGPGTYPLKDPVNEFLKKQMGNRGYYDTYSGERNKIVSGHYVRKPSHNLGPGHYKVNTFLDVMNHRHHTFKGKFLKEVQYPAKPHQRVYWDDPANVPPDPNNQISAASYNPPLLEKKVSFSDHAPPFMSAVGRDYNQSTFFTGNATSVGPGRYEPTRHEANIYINPHHSSFKSVGVRLTREQEKTLRLRLRAKNTRRDGSEVVSHHATEQSPRCAIVSQKDRPLRLE